MHAMRGISAHSNGFQTCRAIHLLQALLGTIDCPGGHLAKPPYPKHVVPAIKPAKTTAPNTPLSGPPLGFPTGPEDLVVDDEGRPMRIDKAYSWEAPIANHGLMHTVIRNAVNADPYAIDTLMLFMANMAWNSSMNTSETMQMLCAKDEAGNYKIPFIVTCDAFHSETVNYSDLVLPDTTYLERFDTISMLDRPISEPHAACDAIRQPVLQPDRNVRPWQEVLVDLASRLNFPLFTKEDGSPEYQGYQDFIARFEKSPGVGFLAGWRGEQQDQHLTGAPNPEQWERYQENETFFEHTYPEEIRYFRHANRDYLEFAKNAQWIGSTDQMIIELYSENLQTFRLAAQGLYGDYRPPEELADRIKAHFDPLPYFYPPLEQQQLDGAGKGASFPFYAITQRPMHMYHSWDSQNTWLRQITAQNYLYMNTERAIELGISDLSWVWVRSHIGKIRAQVKHMHGTQRDTVWTWNAIGKRKGTWGLGENAPESNQAFLLNHLISDLLPQGETSNSDPVTGQAAWYDLKVAIEPCTTNSQESWPQFDRLRSPAGCSKGDDLAYSSGENINLTRSFFDSLTKGKS
jgi:anaerobic selenocysteine-containing dehydrogenase